jgi:hypothetical protein
MKRHQAIGLFAAFAVAFMLLVVPGQASAQNACMQQCDNTHQTCINNCASTAGTDQAKVCVDSCQRGYEGCKGRCGSSGSLNDIFAQDSNVPAQTNQPQKSVPLHLAQSSHDQICQSNYNVCMNGCGGATSCSNQCKANLDGCLAQGR